MGGYWKPVQESQHRREGFALGGTRIFRNTQHPQATACSHVQNNRCFPSAIPHYFQRSSFPENHQHPGQEMVVKHEFPFHSRHPPSDLKMWALDLFCGPGTFAPGGQNRKARKGVQPKRPEKPKAWIRSIRRQADPQTPRCTAGPLGLLQLLSEELLQALPQAKIPGWVPCTW